MTPKTASSNRYIIVNEFLMSKLRRRQAQQVDNEAHFGDSYVCIYREEGRHIQRCSKGLPMPDAEKVFLICTHNDRRMVLREAVTKILYAEGLILITQKDSS